MWLDIIKMEDNTKIYIQRGVIFAVLVVGVFFVIKKIKQAKLKKAFGDVGSLTNDSKGNTLGGATAGKDYGIIAKQLHEKMDGVDWFGTQEQKIIDILVLLTCEEREKVKIAFETTYGDGNTLDTWFQGDLSGDKLQIARDLMSCKSSFEGDELDDDGYTIGASPSQPIRVSVTNTGATPMPVTIGGIGK